MKLMIKAKYVKRWRGKDGKYRYEYKHTKCPNKAGKLPIGSKEPKLFVKVPDAQQDSNIGIGDAAREVVANVINERIGASVSHNLLATWIKMKYPDATHDEILDNVDAVFEDLDISDQKYVQERAINYATMHMVTLDIAVYMTKAADTIENLLSSDEISRYDIDNWLSRIQEDIGGFDPEYFQNPEDWDEYIVTDSQGDEVMSVAEVIRYAIDNQKPIDMAKDEIEEQGIGAMSFSGTPLPEYQPDIVDSNYEVRTSETPLKTGDIVGGKSLGGGVNETYRVQIKNGEYVEAVFKPSAGETTHDVHPEVPMGEQYIREIASYEMDKLFDIQLVPPTILKSIEGQTGSVQTFVQDGDIAKFVDWEGNLSQTDMAAAALFDYLAESMDRHNSNFMVGSDFSLHLIDNGYSFGTEKPNIWNKSPFLHNKYGHNMVDILSDLPTRITDKLASVSLEDYQSMLESTTMDHDAIDRAIERLEKVKDYMEDYMGYSTEANSYDDEVLRLVRGA